MLSLMFSVQDYSSLADTPTGLPLAEIFRQATQTRGGAFGLVFLVWVALGPCMLGSQLSRLIQYTISQTHLTAQALEECFGRSLETAASPFPECKKHPSASTVYQFTNSFQMV